MFYKSNNTLMSKYKTTGNQTLSDAENAAQKLSDRGNPQVKLVSVTDFEMFRSIITFVK